MLNLDTNKQIQSWNFYRYPPGFIWGNQIIRLQNVEGGHCNDQFACSSKIKSIQMDIFRQQIP